MKTAILFDLDGTLLNTLEDLRDAVNHTLKSYGFPQRSLEEIRCFVGNGVETLIRKALPQEGQHLLEKVLLDYKTYYSTHNRIKTRPYDGVLEVLEALKEKYPVAIVSNKQDSAVKPMCREYFGDCYALGEAAGIPRKPAPDMVFKAMAELGAERCVYIGDSEVDVATAQNAGCLCISVLWGFRSRRELTAAGAKHLCQSPRELPGLIEILLEDTNG